MHSVLQQKEAAELAGLRCDRIINEPTAAALAYGHKKTDDRIVLYTTWEVVPLMYRFFNMKFPLLKQNQQSVTQDWEEKILMKYSSFTF